MDKLSPMSHSALAQQWYELQFWDIRNEAQEESQNSLMDALETWRRAYNKKNGTRIRRVVIKTTTGQ